jgi:hypothetical protein
MYRILYHRDTGLIERCIDMNDEMLAKNLANNPHWSYLDGYLDNASKKKVNLQTMAIEEREPFQPNIADYIRSKRANLLRNSDWTDTLSAKTRLGDDLYNQWQTYRQALRDMPDTVSVNTVEEIVWPARP